MMIQMEENPAVIEKRDQLEVMDDQIWNQYWLMILILIILMIFVIRGK